MPTSLLALLSLPLVAFTIELDNEFEHCAVHRTTLQPGGGARVRGPWLTSFAMYANCLQHLGEAAISVGDLQTLARSATDLDGMRRWGYVRLSAPPGKPSGKRPTVSWLIELTSAGRVARETWRPLPQLVEERWRDRFGAEAVSSVRDVLLEANRASALAYPDFLPILGYGLFTVGKGPGRERTLPPASEVPLKIDSPMTALLSRLLYAFASDFERKFSLSLAIGANLLRVLDACGVPNKELPQRTGVSKEAIAMSAGILNKAGFITISSGAGKTLKLTTGGSQAQRHASRLICEIEQHWQQAIGRDTMQRLREALGRIVGDPDDRSSLLFQGLRPHADNWRTSAPATLPHFPMVLHRGGYPDGS